eukprot:6173332-Pleurochrysis_carterae.AAC.1
MQVFHEDAIFKLGLGPGEHAFEIQNKQRYSVGADGQVAWIESESIDTYFLSDKVAFLDYLSFETRELANRVAAFGSSKGTVVKAKQHGLRVVCTLIPPILIELCRRSHGRNIVLAVTYNVFTLNDQGGVDLPPIFQYAEGERSSFKRLALRNLLGMRDHGNILLSRMMTALLRRESATLGGESEGKSESEAASEEEEEMEEESGESQVHSVRAAIALKSHALYLCFVLAGMPAGRLVTIGMQCDGESTLARRTCVRIILHPALSGCAGGDVRFRYAAVFIAAFPPSVSSVVAETAQQH